MNHPHIDKYVKKIADLQGMAALYMTEFNAVNDLDDPDAWRKVTRLSELAIECERQAIALDVELWKLREIHSNPMIETIRAGLDELQAVS